MPTVPVFSTGMYEEEEVWEKRQKVIAEGFDSIYFEALRTEMQILQAVKVGEILALDVTNVEGIAKEAKMKGELSTISLVLGYLSGDTVTEKDSENE